MLIQFTKSIPILREVALLVTNTRLQLYTRLHDCWFQNSTVTVVFIILKSLRINQSYYM